MKVFIENSRFVECVADLTHALVTSQFGEGFAQVEGSDGTLVYTDEAQDFFNSKYDEIETKLNQTLGVHSSNELEDAFKKDN